MPDINGLLLQKLGLVDSNFDTALTPEQEREYQQWAQIAGPGISNTSDYDNRGAYLAGMLRLQSGPHGTDEFKKPNHPTISNESRYDNGMGGSWQGNTFLAGPQNVINMGQQGLQRYFEKVEPGIAPLMPDGVNYEQLRAVARAMRNRSGE